MSQDGRILAVPLMERGYDVIEVPLDGSPPRDVIATPRDEVAPSWSPDGSRFAYVTNRSGVDQLWLRNRSQGLEQLIAAPKDFPGVPSPVFLDSAISPDGTRVAYRMETGRNFSIWISALSGDTPVRLWNDPAQVQRGAAWSPDGAWIAYYSARDGRNAIFKARVGGQCRARTRHLYQRTPAGALVARRRLDRLSRRQGAAHRESGRATEARGERSEMGNLPDGPRTAPPSMASPSTSSATTSPPPHRPGAQPRIQVSGLPPPPAVFFFFFGFVAFRFCFFPPHPKGMVSPLSLPPSTLDLFADFFPTVGAAHRPLAGGNSVNARLIPFTSTS